MAERPVEGLRSDLSRQQDRGVRASCDAHQISKGPSRAGENRIKPHKPIADLQVRSIWKSLTLILRRLPAAVQAGEGLSHRHIQDEVVTVRSHYFPFIHARAAGSPTTAFHMISR